MMAINELPFLKLKSMIIKKNFLLLVGLFIIGLLQAQVGVNTKTPYVNSVFHIDSKGNNSSSAAVTAIEAADDIVINSSGNIGVGTVNPTAKIHIDSSNESIKPIRIADGSQGINKYLFSDSEGKVTWKDKPMPNGIVYYSKNSGKTYPRNVATEVPVETNPFGYTRIRIPKEGNYVFTLRWWGSIPDMRNLTATTRIMSAATIQLRKVVGGSYVIADEANVYTAVASGGASFEPRFSFTISLFASGLNTGDVFYLTVNPTTDTNYGVYDWATGAALNATQSANTIYFPSVMVYNI